jgi:tungstate transport system substrate-binding protein
MTLTRRLLIAAGLAAALIGRPEHAPAQEKFITLASTTSTEQSGLFAHLLPKFQEATGIEVRVVAVGTGQALEMGRKGDADALLVHDRAGEDKFVSDGFGIDATAALTRIAASKAPFASRGDDSGTHRMELRLWKAAAVDVKAAGVDWYRELGQGMGPTLNTAAGMNAYVLADRATWANFKNRQDLAILVESDARLLNLYGSILVSPAKFPHVKAELARAWHEWLTSGPGQKAIAAYAVNGEQLFFPDAGKTGS